jgi:hypothetical protein
MICGPSFTATDGYRSGTPAPDDAVESGVEHRGRGRCRRCTVYLGSLPYPATRSRPGSGERGEHGRGERNHTHILGELGCFERTLVDHIDCAYIIFAPVLFSFLGWRCGLVKSSQRKACRSGTTGVPVTATLPTFRYSERTRHSSVVALKGVTRSSTTRINKLLQKKLLIRNIGLYEEIEPIDSARHNSRHAPLGCLEGTRTSALALLHDWARSCSPAFGIFWLSGMAGTGKTTIAKTFCDQLALEGTLGSSFFISRQDKARQDLRNILRTLAYDLTLLNASRA